MKKTSLKALLLTALVAAFVLAGATGAYAATIRGLVRDGYFSTPLSGIQVTLVEAANADSVVSSTTTGPDGRYQFSSVADSTYYLYFSDPNGAYWPMWFDAEETFDMADPIDVSGSDVFLANADLSGVHVKIQSRLSTATVSADSSDVPLLGDAVTIDTTATDVLWGDTNAGQRVVVQTSSNRITWTTIGPADDYGDGTYHYGFTPTTTDVRYIRFAIGEASDSVATTSPSVRIAPRMWPTRWEGATLDGTSTASLVAPVGAPVRIRARLFDQNEAPMTGANVIVQMSSDGVNWHDGPAASAAATLTGQYETTGIAGLWSFYRFYYQGVGYNQPKASGAVTITSPWHLIATAPTRLKANKKTFIQGSVTPVLPAGVRPLVTVQWHVRGKWRTYKTYWPTTSVGQATFFYKRLAFPKGDFRWKVSLPGDAYRFATSTVYAPIKVR
ncbi:MAG: carboxypeptidase regulatory-like domain-containing protein [Coriobacteriia bacterium]|nr:carboxypeptidase regulatory-like domain-containing protein [Coriobacteriia bacterium]